MTKQCAWLRILLVYYINLSYEYSKDDKFMLLYDFFFREVITHIIQCYADEMKSAPSQRDQDPEDQPMEIGQ